jgi:tRNA(Ile)-lysidine synthase TilS/MesJ
MTGERKITRSAHISDDSRPDVLSTRLHYLFRRVKKAQKEFVFIDEDDKVLVALSGGKDSTTLCHVLAHWRSVHTPRFSLAAVHAQPNSLPDADSRKTLLTDHMDSLDIPVDFVELDLQELSNSENGGKNCFRCAWKRRRELFVYAAENGFNKIAFGHHLDDAVETVLMNLLYHGTLETMEPVIEFFEGAVTVIRPLILAEEKEIRRVSSVLDFPFSGCLCPEDHETQRDEAKRFINSFGRKSRMIKSNLWRASRSWGTAISSGRRDLS